MIGKVSNKTLKEYAHKIKQHRKKILKSNKNIEAVSHGVEFSLFKHKLKFFKDNDLCQFNKFTESLDRPQKMIVITIKKLN